MYAKVIKTKIEKGGVIHVVDRELPAGDAEVVVLTQETGVKQPVSDLKKLPIGGYKAGWLTPQQLRREALYEDA